VKYPAANSLFRVAKIRFHLDFASCDTGNQQVQSRRKQARKTPKDKFSRDQDDIIQISIPSFRSQDYFRWLSESHASHFQDAPERCSAALDRKFATRVLFFSLNSYRRFQDKGDARIQDGQVFSLA
jgi:hypothetical protein